MSGGCAIGSFLKPQPYCLSEWTWDGWPFLQDPITLMLCQLNLGSRLLNTYRQTLLLISSLSSSVAGILCHISLSSLRPRLPQPVTKLLHVFKTASGYVDS